MVKPSLRPAQLVGMQLPPQHGNVQGGSRRAPTVDEEGFAELTKLVEDSNNTKLASIVGSARGGKSFMANALYSRPGTEASCSFPVTASNKPCTKGVDFLPQDIRLADISGDQHTQDDKDIQVVVTDTEGCGDQDDHYDAALLLPVLAVSDVVIFNWMGPPARHEILQALGFLAKAAHTLMRGDQGQKGGASGPPQQVLGHLHIVLRDRYDASGLMEMLLEDEEGEAQEVQERNAMRAVLRQCFASVRVWALPPPIADAQVLATTALCAHTSELTPAFKTALDELRAAIVQQLRGDGEPSTGLARRDGPTLCALLRLLVQAATEEQGAGGLLASVSSLLSQAQLQVLDKRLEQLKIGATRHLDCLLQTRPPAELKTLTAELAFMLPKAQFQASLDSLLQHNQPPEHMARLEGQAKEKVEALLAQLWHGFQTRIDKALAQQRAAAAEARRLEEQEEAARREAELREATRQAEARAREEQQRREAKERERQRLEEERRRREQEIHRQHQLALERELHAMQARMMHEMMTMQMMRMHHF